MSLTLARANQLVAKAMEAATTHEVTVVVVVTDLGGHAVSLQRMEAASYINAETAQRKAIMASAFATPTHQVQTMIGKDPIAGPIIAADQRVSLLPGGVPILVDGRCVGGLGVAGGHYLQDQAIAEDAVSQ